ncbi:multidrug effflux MFS transporter [Macrococcoides canis]|uniref:Bcr/CflA family efflux transporter n=1 Tax=Macrococcoides canis TaxID=1855823 RepID=A0A1W7A8H2_9STAP|nr:multidrug effflux MFS transporter [Macrococcus canis]ARQ05945.1 Bicyclomycin resistance protein [Macrococcus canis]UJS28031.1 multidrug effflux MFS transporter [Macrococcus canis]UTH00301.1 multidrug effflux MFS transporter [Macrococcus canis]WBF52691.1 multidrug effflux MFS transporter [Macrococcus canis]
MKKHNKLILIVTLGLLAAFGPLSLDMYLPALPRVADDLSTSASYAQLSLTACMIGLAVGQIIVGPISDVTGRKKPLFIVLIGYGLFSYFAARAATIEWLIFFRFIQGFCGGAGAVLSRAISSDLYKGKDLTKFLAVLMLVNGLAPVLAPVLGGFILSVSTWHTVFYILAVYGVLMVLLALTLEESLPKFSRNEGALKSIWNDFKLLLTNKAFVTMLLLQSLTYGVLFSYISGSPFITQKIYGMNAQQFSYLFALNGIGLIAFSQLTAKLVNKMDELKILKLGQNIQFIGMMLTVIVLLFHLPVWMLCAAFFLMITPVSMIGTTGFSIAMQVQNQGAGSASAILGLMQFLIGGILSPLVGVMGERSIIPFIVIIIACTVLAQSIRMIWVKNIEI